MNYIVIKKKKRHFKFQTEKIIYKYDNNLHSMNEITNVFCLLFIFFCSTNVIIYRVYHTFENVSFNFVFIKCFWDLPVGCFKWQLAHCVWTFVGNQIL